MQCNKGLKWVIIPCIAYRIHDHYQVSHYQARRQGGWRGSLEPYKHHLASAHGQYLYSNTTVVSHSFASYTGKLHWQVTLASNTGYSYSYTMVVLYVAHGKMSVLYHLQIVIVDECYS